VVVVVVVVIKRKYAIYFKNFSPSIIFNFSDESVSSETEASNGIFVHSH